MVVNDHCQENHKKILHDLGVTEPSYANLTHTWPLSIILREYFIKNIYYFVAGFLGASEKRRAANGIADNRNTTVHG